MFCIPVYPCADMWYITHALCESIRKSTFTCTCDVVVSLFIASWYTGLQVYFICHSSVGLIPAAVYTVRNFCVYTEISNCDSFAKAKVHTHPS